MRAGFIFVRPAGLHYLDKKVRIIFVKMRGGATYDAS